MRYSELEKFEKEIEGYACIRTIRPIDKDKFEFEIHVISTSECGNLLVCIQKYFFMINGLTVVQKYGTVDSLWFECEVRDDFK
ncbi:MAG: hypothetical protein K6E14_11345 [Paludibacteraceae bacterium]|nr:hypothetical protein [Paludibacteraceae bacterium]